MKRRAFARGFTLVELLVAVAVLAFVTMLLYGAFSGMKRSRDGLTRMQGRYREGRLALARFVRDLESAYISSHAPLNAQLVLHKTAFMGQGGFEGDYFMSRQFALSGRVMGRYAKASDVDVTDDPADGTIDLDMSGFAFNLGLRVFFGGGQ